MLKKYIPIAFEKGERFWDRNWRSTNIKEALRFCEIDPFSKIFDKYLPKEGKILEAGCGLAQYVIYYRKKGYDMEGVDFAQETIKRVLKFDKTLPVKVADVKSLPYPDNYFKAYYSGGVAEHFEEGPDKVLKEAYRVLAPGGILIITVPYLNPFRKFRSLRLKDSIQIDHDGREVKYVYTKEPKKEENPFSDYLFHEYYYQKGEFLPFLLKNKFRIIYMQGALLSWGLKDIALFRSLFKPRDGERKNSLEDSKERSNFSGALRSYLKKVIVTEKADNFAEKFIISNLQRIFSNLILFVCKSEKAG